MLLPSGIRVDDIKATMADGTLVVTAPAALERESHV